MEQEAFLCFLDVILQPLAFALVEARGPLCLAINLRVYLIVLRKLGQMVNLSGY